MRRQQSHNSDLIIIGGGASGLAAACVALQRGLRVTVLEARDRIGRKLLATGNGRCNLLNLGPPVYFGDAGFAGLVLRACPAQEVLAFFDGLGLVIAQEEGGLVYPASNQASTVLDTLRLPLERDPRCLIVCDAGVTGLEKEHQENGAAPSFWCRPPQVKASKLPVCWWRQAAPRSRSYRVPSAFIRSFKRLATA